MRGQSESRERDLQEREAGREKEEEWVIEEYMAVKYSVFSNNCSERTWQARCLTT